MSAVPVFVMWTAPFALALVAAIATLILDALQRERDALAVAIGGLTLAAAVELVALAGRAPRIVEGLVQTGGGAATVAAFSFAIGAMTLLGGAPGLAARGVGGRVAALVVFASMGSALAASAADLGLLLIGLETAALVGYALVAERREDSADEAAIRYFVQGAIATALLVYGIAVTVAVQGTASYSTGATVPATPATSLAIPVVIAMLLGVFAFKLGAFPFHAWAPDAYEAPSPSVAAYISSVPKMAALPALVFVALSVLDRERGSLEAVLPALAAASIVYGNLAGLRQPSYRRMLAYSGIGQVGYALLVLVGGRESGFVGGILFMTAYAVANAGAFLAAEAMERDGCWDGSVAGLAGLSAKRPVMSLALAVCMLSLVGIPPFAGFWGKFHLFGAAAAAGWWGLAVVGVIGSVVSFGMYGGVLRAVFLDPPRGDEAVGDGRGDAASTSVVIAALVIIVLGLIPVFTGLTALGPVLRLN